jgi:hypothetical protein
MAGNGGAAGNLRATALEKIFQQLILAKEINEFRS